VFLDPGQEKVCQVRRAVAHLHPTFQPSTAPLARDPGGGQLWTMPHTGWGTFDVRLEVEVAAQDGKTVTVEVVHTLDFSTPLSAHAVDLPAKPLVQDACTHELRAVLSREPFMGHGAAAFTHGRLFQGSFGGAPSLPAPQCTWHCSQPPRDDHEAPKWLTGSEYQDEEEVLELKCQTLAALIRESRKTVVYSGAGISVAAGIGQAARGNFKAGKNTDAQPTMTHWCLGELSKHGLLHGWVQQNHDGLPQKAGFPQELINEVHGSWYDPSNPVVKYSGSLKHENYTDMVAAAETADLVLVLGTSLGGLNADQVAVKAAERSLLGKSLGMVIINLQQTVQDGKASLRIFGRTDTVFPRILSLLDVPVPAASQRGGNALPAQLTPKDLCIPVPYGADGRRCKDPALDEEGVEPQPKPCTWLDLHPGAKIRLTEGHNIQGAGQIGLMHIGAKKPFRYQESVRQPGDGTGVVEKVDMKRSCINIRINGASMRLGIWWLDVARRGGAPTLPVVNVSPKPFVARAGTGAGGSRE